MLGILAPGVDVGDGPEGDTEPVFRAGEDGESLVERDVVRTDPSGFAEVRWFEGALARVDADTTYTVVALDTTPGAAVVVTELEVGRVWNRLDEGSVSSYEVRTDVGTAAVRGTAFWVSCTAAGACTFAVLEGDVVITTEDGEEVALGPGDEVTIDGDGTVGPVVDTDPGADWVARNEALDAEGEPAADDGDTAAGAEFIPISERDCPLVQPDGWREEASDAEQFGDRPCRFVRDERPLGEFTAIEFTAIDYPGTREGFLSVQEAVRESITSSLLDGGCSVAATLEEVIDEPLGDAAIFGHWWRVVSGGGGCGFSGSFGWEWYVAVDGLLFELRAPYGEVADVAAFTNQCVPEDNVIDDPAQYADCLAGLHAEVVDRYRALAAEVVGA